MALTRRFILPDEIAPAQETPAEKPAPFEPPGEELAITIVTKTPVTDPIPEKLDIQPTAAVEETVTETEPATPDTVEEKSPEPAAAEQAEEKPKKKTSKAKQKTETEEEIIHVRNSLGKNQDLREALASVLPEYNDPAFEEFKKNLMDDLRLTTFNADATSAEIRVVLSRLSQCYDNVAFQYADINKNLEQLANKTYGLITRQIAVNAIGANDAARKKNSIHAPEVYKDASGKTMNLYALQAGLEQEAMFLQMVMKSLDYKRSTLIAYLTANKLEADTLGD